MEYNKRKGIVNVNISMVNKATLTDNRLYYQGIMLNEFSIVGYVISFDDIGTKTIVKIWDQTGFMNVSFFKSNESDVSGGVKNFIYKGPKTPMRIFVKTNVQKDTIHFNGLTLHNATGKEIIYHKIILMVEWLNLTKVTKSPNSNLDTATKSSVNILRKKIIAAIDKANKDYGECKKQYIYNEFKNDPNIDKELKEMEKESIIFVEDNNFILI